MLVSLYGLMIVAMATAGSAFAQSAETQYSPGNEQVSAALGSGGGGGGGGTGTEPVSSGGALPFTGFDVMLALTIAAVLIGTGLLLRRAARARELDA